MKVQLLTHTKNPELMIATAAKLCYSASGINDLMEAQNSEQVEKFISRLESLGHESPFEHVSFTFAVEGVSRALTHQLVRHRIASYSQQSQRYVKLNQFAYVIPDEIKDNETAKKIFIESMEKDQKAYDDIVQALMRDYISEYSGIRYSLDTFKDVNKKKYNEFEKKAIENARYVFPNACETKIVVTMNVRTLWNFLKHRCCNRAQDEIRELAKTMLKILKAEFPLLFKHAGAACVSGICPENAMQCIQLKGKIPTQDDVKLLIKNHWKKEE